jgi:hypothetical protein
MPATSLIFVPDDLVHLRSFIDSIYMALNPSAVHAAHDYEDEEESSFGEEEEGESETRKRRKRSVSKTKSASRKKSRGSTTREQESKSEEEQSPSDSEKSEEGGTRKRTQHSQTRVDDRLPNVEKGPLDGMVFALGSSIRNDPNREELQQLIRSLGGVFASGYRVRIPHRYSNRTTHSYTHTTRTHREGK